MRITHLNIALHGNAVPDSVKSGNCFYNRVLEAVVDGLRADLDRASKTVRERPEPVAHHVRMSERIGPSGRETFQQQVVNRNALIALPTSLRSCARPGQNRRNLRKEMCASATT